MFSHRSSKDAPNCARRERLIVTARQRIVDGKLYSQACSLGASESSLDSCLPSRETACLQEHALCNGEYTSDTITRRRERERPGDNNQTAPQYLFVYTLPAACHKGRINLYAYQLALERALHFKCHRLGALEEEKEKLTIAYCAGLCWHSFLNFVFFFINKHTSDWGDVLRRPLRLRNQRCVNPFPGAFATIFPVYGSFISTEAGIFFFSYFISPT